MRRPLLLALTLAGCASSPCVTPTPPGAQLTGQVSVPQRWLDPNAGMDPTPVARAQVAVANAAGQPIAGTFHAQTVDGGNYAIAQLPPNYTYMVTAQVPTPDGKTQTLASLAKPTKQANLDLATTLVTIAVTDGLTGVPGDVDQATFDTVASTVRAHLTDPDIPLPSDTAAVKAKIADLAKNDPTLAGQLDQLEKQAAAPSATPQQLADDVAKNADQDPLSALAPVY